MMTTTTTTKTTKRRRATMSSLQQQAPLPQPVANAKCATMTPSRTVLATQRKWLLLPTQPLMVHLFVLRNQKQVRKTQIKPIMKKRMMVMMMTLTLTTTMMKTKMKMMMKTMKKLPRWLMLRPPVLQLQVFLTTKPIRLLKRNLANANSTNTATLLTQFDWVKKVGKDAITNKSLAKNWMIHDSFNNCVVRTSKDCVGLWRIIIKAV
mmetsp:Transcript_14688/g.25182  ORF Transcript_14688/g.25182 Transcript_14688/m.25182 type:complete len:207 (-) Transcript_14688:1360-1980(-)